MALYLHAQYDFPYGQQLPPDSYIGPFPDAIAVQLFVNFVGKGIAKLEDLDYVPPPEQTMTPGQMVDHQLGRWQ